MCRACRMTAATMLVLLVVIVGTAVRAAPAEARKDAAPDFPALFQRIESLRQQGEYGRAVDAARAILKQAEATLPAEDRRLTDASEAEAAMRRAVYMRERTEGMEGALTLQSLCTLGAIAADRGDMSIADSLVRASLDRRRLTLPKGHPGIAESCLELARIQLFFGKERAAEATKLATEALDTYRKVYGPTHEWTLMAMHAKADGRAALGRQTESDQLHQEIIATIERLPKPRTDMLSDLLRDYGRHMRAARKPARAAELCRRALALQPKTRPPADSRVIATRKVLAESLYDMGKGDEAVREGRAILAALDQAGSDSAGDAGVARTALARYLLATGGMEEARGLLREAVKQLDGAVGRGSREIRGAERR